MWDMNQEQREAVVSALVAFVLRAAKGDATSEEVQVLPEVARLLI